MVSYLYCESNRWPPSIVFSVRSVLGIDVGGTKIAVAAVDVASAGVISREVIPTRTSRGGAGVLDDCRSLAERHMRVDTVGIGIGVCELVGLDGRVHSAYSFDWRPLDVSGRFEDLAPCTIESDARTGAIAELRLGSGRSDNSFLFVGVGTGVSAALVEHGDVRCGARGNAIFIGDPELERRSGGGALAKEYGAGLTEAFADSRFVPRLRAAAADVGASIGVAVNILDPQRIVIGGGLGNNLEYFQWLTDGIRGAIYAEDTRRLRIDRSELGSEAGVLGAALTAVDRYNAVESHPGENSPSNRQ